MINEITLCANNKKRIQAPNCFSKNIYGTSEEMTDENENANKRKIVRKYNKLWLILKWQLTQDNKKWNRNFPPVPIYSCPEGKRFITFNKSSN